ncbi:agouti-related protein isoform X2 [Natator depressus]|uniref:agouti-related protein isoform X2 n=1 Tax=Natator depressus TaxID=27790 RepID=UPI003EB979B7
MIEILGASFPWDSAWGIEICRPHPVKVVGRWEPFCVCLDLSQIGTLPRPGFDRMAMELRVADEDLMQEASVLEPEVLSAALEAQGREERAPRRCVRLLESCLGHQLPCCDPCATCYCRFFNAFCYCRKISATLLCGKN